MWVPKFQYPATTGTQLTLARPMGFWEHRQETVGGFRDSAAGVRAAITIRRDYLLDIVLRFPEDNLDDVETMVAWMQDNPSTAFTFWPDVDVTGTSYASLLVSPGIGESLRATRNGTFKSDLETTLTLKRSNGAAWPLVWYPD